MSGPEKIKPVCPSCGSSLICELATVEASYFIDYVTAEPGKEPQPEYSDSTYSDDGEFAGYYCRDCQCESPNLSDFLGEEKAR